MQAILINSLYIYLLLGLLVSALEAVAIVRSRSPTTLMELITYLVLGVLVWPYILYAIRRR